MEESDHEGAGWNVTKKEAKEDASALPWLIAGVEVGVVLGRIDVAYVMRNKRTQRGMTTPVKASWKRSACRGRINGRRGRLRGRE